MRIGIDASRAVKSLRTGVENYSFEVIRELLKIDRTNSYVLYAPHQPKEDWPRGREITWRILPQQRLWTQLRLARELKADPPDVLFIPSHVVPVMSNLPTVVTIHDLAYKYFPKSYSNFDRRYLNFSTGVSAAKSRLVIVPSAATKRDLIKEYGVADEKIIPIPLAYNGEVFNPDATVGRPPLKGPYVLYVGRIEEKKNLRLLVEAFNLLSKERRAPMLVLSGKNGYGFELIQHKIAALPPKIRSRIVQPGYLPQYDMLAYLKHATVFAFPSWYEGFGLSVLEALAMGTPVVCSNTSSLPEVTGEAALLLAPTNPLSWAAALSRIINQPKFAQTLRQKGLRRAAQFSWTTTAQRTLEVLGRAAAKS